MTVGQWGAATVIGIVLLGIGLWWWVTRPPQEGDHVSQIWRDEHSRERRD